jgi:hypothetical protein
MRHMNHMQGLLRRRVGLICVPVDELVHFVHSFNQWVLIRWGVVEFVYDGERERERERNKKNHMHHMQYNYHILIIRIVLPGGAVQTAITANPANFLFPKKKEVDGCMYRRRKTKQRKTMLGGWRRAAGAPPFFLLF